MIKYQKRNSKIICLCQMDSYFLPYPEFTLDTYLADFGDQLKLGQWSNYTRLSLFSYASVHSPADRHFLKLYTLHALKYIMYILQTLIRQYRWQINFWKCSYKLLEMFLYIYRICIRYSYTIPKCRFSVESICVGPVCGRINFRVDI